MSSVMKQEKTSKSDVKTYSKKDTDAAIEKLITARVSLLLRHPFFGNMATRLILEDASDWCPTLATDGRRFYYNVGWMTKATQKNAEFGFGHEVLHNVFQHMDRRDGRDPELSNIAADYAVNQILKDEKIGEPPAWMKIYQDNKYRGKSFEEIYDDLVKNSKVINIKSLGDLFDEHMDNEDTEDDPDDKRPKLTDEEKRKIRDEIKEAMVSAMHSAGAGRTPAGVARLISDFTSPKMDWRELLRLNIQGIRRSNFSFSRPSRKSQMTGFILPGMVSEETIDVCCAIDMSGSISNKQANDFISEVKGIMEEYNDFTLKLWCFDTRVYNYAEFTQDNASDIMDYQAKGGGGTDFDANYNYMKQNDINPKKFIMFTDGYPCGSWGDSNHCDSLFIIHGNETIIPPFGQVAYYK